MSIRFAEGTEPTDLEIKSADWGGTTWVYLGDYKIHVNVFMQMALYVLENTDLGETPETRDNRLNFLDVVKHMRVVDGYNEGRKRLEEHYEERPDEEAVAATMGPEPD